MMQQGSGILIPCGGRSILPGPHTQTLFILDLTAPSSLVIFYAMETWIPTES
jgi:hypothetical protein